MGVHNRRYAESTLKPPDADDCRIEVGAYQHSISSTLRPMASDASLLDPKKVRSSDISLGNGESAIS